MNEILANIYGTLGAGMEKQASERLTLNDLALAMVTDGSENEGDLEKVASDHAQVLDSLLQYDQIGRAMAQIDYTEMEKQAAEGDPSALQAFWADYQEEEPEMDLREQARLELARRLESR